jgi:hypothetical protein
MNMDCPVIPGLETHVNELCEIMNRCDELNVRLRHFFEPHRFWKKKMKKNEKK